jgi:hypothetical protein
MAGIKGYGARTAAAHALARLGLTNEAAQGFFLARPMSASALTEILESRRPGSEIGDERAAG